MRKRKKLSELKDNNIKTVDNERGRVRRVKSVFEREEERIEHTMNAERDRTDTEIWQKLKANNWNYMQLEQNVDWNLSIDIDFILSHTYYAERSLFTQNAIFCFLPGALVVLMCFFLLSSSTFPSRLCAKIMKFASVLCNIPRAQHTRTHFTLPVSFSLVDISLYEQCSCYSIKQKVDCLYQYQ